MDYSHFRFSAVVDWIEVEFSTKQTTNAPTIRRKCRIAGWVIPLNPAPSGAADSFRTRLHGPKGWRDVTAFLHSISAEFPFQTPPTVTGIEVSFDAKSKNATREELAELTARLYKFSAFVSSRNHRYEGAYRGGVTGISGGFERVKAEIGRGRVIAIGNQNNDRAGRWKRDPISQRVYLKTTDNNGQALPESEHRARIEVTLQDEGLPCRTLREWANFDFTSLTDKFRFRQIAPRLSDAEQLIADRIEQIGERHPRNRQEGGTRLYGKLTSADTTLNKRAKDALQRLTDRWGISQSLAEISAQNSSQPVENTKVPLPTLITTYTTPLPDNADQEILGRKASIATESA